MIDLNSNSNSNAIDILYEHGAVFVLNKPRGLLTQAPPGIESLEWQFRQYIKQRLSQAGNIYVGVPHRLDRPVSGAIVLVRNVRAAQRISAQFESRTVKKTYWAVVEGSMSENQGTWIDWMRKLPDEAKSEIVSPEEVDAKKAVLHYRIQAKSGDNTFVEIELETGRTHQIRLQLSAHGYPVVGDNLYGAKTSFGEPILDQRKQKIALHARQIVFEHPMAHHKIDVVAPLDAQWEQFTVFRSNFAI